jgi:hypothetical protein
MARLAREEMIDPAEVQIDHTFIGALGRGSCRRGQSPVQAPGNPLTIAG